MVRLIFTLFFLVSAYGAQAQLSHCHWKLSSKKINECEYDLIFTLSLDKGWHTFSVTKIKGAEKEVASTEINFESSKSYSLIGNLTETAPKAEFDETIGKSVLLHYNKAIITQRIKLNTPGPVKVSGSYETQVCSNGVCQRSPYETFEFNLKGTSRCGIKK